MSPPPMPDLFQVMLARFRATPDGVLPPEQAAAVDKFVAFARAALAADPPDSLTWSPAGVGLRTRAGATLLIQAAVATTQGDPSYGVVTRGQSQSGAGMPTLPGHNDVGGAITGVGRKLNRPGVQ